MTVLELSVALRCLLLGRWNILVCITECKLERDLIATPGTLSDELLLSELKLFRRLLLDSGLELVIHHWYEFLVELCPTEGTRHPHIHDALLALKAEEVLARGYDRLRAQVKADWTLVLVCGLRSDGFLNSCSRRCTIYFGCP